jgi:hypothetical protein
VLPVLGKWEEWFRPDRGLLCDMSRVLMTQMGFVAIVLLAPATMDDQKLIT